MYGLSQMIATLAEQNVGRPGAMTVWSLSARNYKQPARRMSVDEDPDSYPASCEYYRILDAIEAGDGTYVRAPWLYLKVRKLATALTYAFFWENSPQGSRYWGEVYNNLLAVARHRSV